MGSIEARNRAVVHRLFDEIWNGRRLDRIPELYSPDHYVDDRPYAPMRHGHDAVREMVERAYETMPDYHEELLDAIAEGERVAVHLRISGTQTGPWGPIAPTGRRLDFEEMLFLTFDADGRVLHQRGIVDNLHGLRPAGAVPNPPLGS
jgi:predicted ester cyclase